MSPLHPDAARLMEIVRAVGRPPFQTLAPEEARRAYGAGRAILQMPPEAVAECRDFSIAGPAGPIPMRLYRGVGTAAGEPLPAILYLHGGGWVIGDLDTHDSLCRRLANLAGSWVAAVDYRLAPEHRFPAALDDAAAAMAWLAAQAPELGIDPRRIAVAGDSAGGNLAAVLALMGRDGTLPPACFQMLFYPATDLTMRTESFARITEGVPLTAETMRWFIEHYTPDADQREDWRASPIKAASLAGTPPALVVTVGHDPLADEGRAYAARLEADGVRVTALHLADQIHGILTMSRIIPGGDAILQFAALALREAWRLP